MIQKATNIMDEKNIEIIKMINNLEVRAQKNVKGRIMFELRISFPTLYRRLNDGFLPHELPVVDKILNEFTQPV